MADNWWDTLPSPTEYAKAGAPAATATADPGQATPGAWWSDLPSPGQYMESADKLPPVINDPSRMADFKTQAVGSLPTDDMAKVQYFAASRFPGMPITQAVDRYFYKDGRLAYKMDDGKAYFEEPSAQPPTSMANLAEDAKAAASVAGPAIPVTTGGVAGAATLDFGGGVPGSAVGGAAGDAIRQWLAHIFTGESKSWGDRGWEAAKAGGEQAVGQILGLGVGKLLPGRTPTFDIAESTRVGDAARRFDIPLTAGEETGNRQLIRRQKILANTSQADETFENFYRGRNEKVGAAVNGLLNDIAPTYPSARVASGAAVEGAQAAVKGARQGMQTEAGPYYTEALKPGNMIELPSLQKNLDPSDQAILKHVTDTLRADPVLGPKVQGWQDTAMFTLDQVKKQTDGMISASKQAGDNYRASILTDFKKKLTGTMDAAYPDYAKARSIYEEGMPVASNTERGVVGDVAKLENNDTLRASQIIFGKGSSPEDVRMARDAFQKAGKADNWDALVRSHLEQTFNEIPESATGAITNVGGTFYKAIYGNARKKAIIEAATEHRPGLQRDVLDLMTALNATGRAMKGESITAFAQMGQKELADEAKGLGPKMLETIEIWKTPSRMAQYWADLQTGKYSARMAELLTTPEGREQLRELRKLGPNSAGAVVGLSQLLTAGGVGLAASQLNQAPDGNASIVANQVPETEAQAPRMPKWMDLRPSSLSGGMSGR